MPPDAMTGGAVGRKDSVSNDETVLAVEPVL
jgi:hypothetical protein